MDVFILGSDRRWYQYRVRVSPGHYVCGHRVICEATGEVVGVVGECPQAVYEYVGRFTAAHPWGSEVELAEWGGSRYA